MSGNALEVRSCGYGHRAFRIDGEAAARRRRQVAPARGISYVDFTIGGDPMNSWDAVGFLASSLVVAAFCMKDILSLRAIALASNVAFLAYGLGLHLAPVWLLHAILLPVNCGRLWQAVRWQRTTVGYVTQGALRC